ncbi:hypothetical protein AAHE18_04G065900 [Arachis hypogaea]
MRKRVGTEIEKDSNFALKNTHKASRLNSVFLFLKPEAAWCPRSLIVEMAEKKDPQVNHTKVTHTHCHCCFFFFFSVFLNWNFRILPPCVFVYGQWVYMNSPRPLQTFVYVHIYGI